MNPWRWRRRRVGRLAGQLEHVGSDKQGPRGRVSQGPKTGCFGGKWSKLLLPNGDQIGIRYRMILRVMQWPSKEGCGFNNGFGSLHCGVCIVSVWVLCGFSGFVAQSMWGELETLNCLRCLCECEWWFVFVCLSEALQRNGDLPKESPCLRPMTAGRGSSWACEPELRNKQVSEMVEWMDYWLEAQCGCRQYHTHKYQHYHSQAPNLIFFSYRHGWDCGNHAVTSCARRGQPIAIR